MKKSIFLIGLILIFVIFTGCNKKAGDMNRPENQGGLSDDSQVFGTSLDELDVYDGYFEGTENDLQIECISGTEGACIIENNVVSIKGIDKDSVYSISGKLNGSIVIDIGESNKLDLELKGLSIISENTSPITILSGDKVSITAKAGYKNYIYDNREAIDENNDELYSGAIHSLCDLEICGKGELTLISKNNNGIHTKDDLEIKNLTLFVMCVDNALKGNDSVTIESGISTLIATKGDGIKTTNNGISEKGNQRGCVSILGGAHTIYSACDGIDSSYNVVIDNENTEVNIYTDKYSIYTEEITHVSENVSYIRYTSQSYKYSVKYYNSDSDYTWVNAEYHSSVSGGRSNYYYYSYPKMDGYSKLQFFIYTSDMEKGQEENYFLASELLTPNEAYDTFALTSRGYSWSYTWTSYTTKIQEGGFGGPGGFGGGMNEGNSDKGDHSTKGIKASNEIIILNGKINIKAYDDGIHANNEETLENGSEPTGNITIENGIITLYSNDDGIHADGKLLIQGGTITISNSYEGIEGTTIEISGGDTSITSKDDGVNATTSTDVGVTISSGKLYIYAGGDGIDSNSRASYKGISFLGGKAIVISTSGGNSAIDTEGGYEYLDGEVIAIMPSGGMSSESTHVSSFSSIGTKKTLSIKAGSILAIEGKEATEIEMLDSMNCLVIYLGSSSAKITTK